jgi:hypothetical protein
LFLKRLEGFQGEITIPSIGLTIATMTSWKCWRREESAPGETGDWTLHAVFAYVNEFAFNESSMEKRMLLSMGRRKGQGPFYRLTWDKATKVALNGRGLIIEGAMIEPWQQH